MGHGVMFLVLILLDNLDEIKTTERMHYDKYKIHDYTRYADVHIRNEICLQICFVSWFKVG